MLNPSKQTFLSVLPKKRFYLTKKTPSIALFKLANDAKTRRRYQLLGEFFGKLVLNKTMWRLLNSLGSRGQFSIDIAGKTQTCIFNATNTQFHAIYSNQCDQGYEPTLSVVMECLLPHLNTFYDVGSNWGYFSILAASDSSFKGQVHAFEPFPSSYRDLQHTVHQLGLSKCITTHPFGLSDEAKFIGMDMAVYSGRARVDNAGSNPRIEVKRLDDLDMLPPPDLIKMDVEDHEHQVLLGGAKTIAKYKPFIMFENSCDITRLDHSEEPFTFLRGKGYLFFYPLLLCESKGSQSLCEEGFYCNNLSRIERLVGIALQQVDFPVRLLLQDTTNFFAVHEDRVNEWKTYLMTSNESKKR